MLAMVWVHGCLGIHRWLSLKSWYNRLWLFFYTLAIMPYVTSMIGVAVGYREAVLRKFDSSWMEMVAENSVAKFGRITNEPRPDEENFRRCSHACLL